MFPNLSWRPPCPAHFVYIPYQTHPMHVLQSLLTSWWVESGVLDKSDIQNAQGRGPSRTGLGSTAIDGCVWKYQSRSEKQSCINNLATFKVTSITFLMLSLNLTMSKCLNASSAATWLANYIFVSKIRWTGVHNKGVVSVYLIYLE